VGREFTPFTIGERFRILPEGESAPDDDRINLIMAPGAFGSGEHETTASCLEILEQLPQTAASSALDLGSGTGILSIAALKLGGRQALCVDINPEAITTCQRNCTLNGVASQVTHVCGTLAAAPKARYNLILANIYGDILIDVANELVAATTPGCPMLLSGILYEYNFDVRRVYQRLGCTVLQNHMLTEFSTVLLRAPE